MYYWSYFTEYFLVGPMIDCEDVPPAETLWELLAVQQLERQQRPYLIISGKKIHSEAVVTQVSPSPGG